MGLRHLVLVFGDQLNRSSAVFDDFDPNQDCVWMMEARGESGKSWSSKQRTAFFLSAMRHFADQLRQENTPLIYRSIDDPGPDQLLDALVLFLTSQPAEKIVFVRPGSFDLYDQLKKLAQIHSWILDERPDRHFLASHDEFDAWALGKKELRMEWFYRHMRKKHQILMDGDEPKGGSWNYDHENRKSFGKKGPGSIKRISFPPDLLTQRVIDDVERIFPNHPGSLVGWNWPVTPGDALLALDDFIDHHLALFGQHQDAMWQGEPDLHHARLAACLNTKMIEPRLVIDRACQAFDQGLVELSSVEGFVRQILGWREYVRGVYWKKMPGFALENALGHHEPLPDFFWTGKTDFNCLHQSITDTLRYGYAHHIQRLMVLGLFAQLVGVEPKQIDQWFLSVYTDAVEWVELPNVLGMSQYADGGHMVSKPYVASGAYIDKMSNYCQSCPYSPRQATGSSACPFTTLYWDFLITHKDRFANHPRTALQWKALDKKSAQEQKDIQEQAKTLRQDLRRRANNT